MNSRTKLKDDAVPLLAAVVCSIGAWAFWHFLGEAGFSVLLAGSVVLLLVDNIRLRRKQR
jgi:hypothetical protein